jgi:beta-glucosidase
VIGCAEHRGLNLEVPAASCSLVTADGLRVVEPGSFELLVGRSSRRADLLAGGFTIAGRWPA